MPKGGYSAKLYKPIHLLITGEEKSQLLTPQLEQKQEKSQLLTSQLKQEQQKAQHLAERLRK